MTEVAYSSDELNPPKWLNSEFFTAALRKFTKNETLEVTKVELRPGTKAGEHYTSIMFKAKVFYDSKNVSENSMDLILKTIPVEEGHKMDLLKESTVFKTEMRIYGEVLPEMQKLLKQIDDETIIAPTLVYQSNDPAPVIVFIDEGPKGFKPYEKPFTFEQVQVLIERIAKFHACSFFLQKIGKLSNFDDCPFTKAEGKVDLLSLFYRDCVFDALKTVKKWKECESYKDILEKITQIFDERLEEIFQDKSKQPYQVLLHGDFQFKNMISRNGGLRSEDFLLLDYQYCYWNSPAIDVISLLCCCCDANTRKNHREEVIRKYFKIFNETLVKLDYKEALPRLLDLQLEMIRCGMVEFMFFMSFTPFQLIDFSKLDLNKLMETRDFHGATKEVFETEGFKEDLLKRLEFLVDMGALE
ncbi:uncharacterized protein LOC134826987 [Culicoides brevitarsis]|uniref:uncharacterized protein LOC134826987 n=1 Tax=Culicoides brevitarsis TaxID=469753 RepID=UPI00307BD426